MYFTEDTGIDLWFPTLGKLNYMFKGGLGKCKISI